MRDKRENSSEGWTDVISKKETPSAYRELEADLSPNLIKSTASSSKPV